MNIGEKIKKRRNELGYTLIQVANAIGVMEATAQRYESGTIKNIPYKRLINLANFLRINPSELIDTQPKINLTPLKIPVLGKVAAGIPIEAIEDILDYEEITEETANGGEFFALKIQGDSMEPKISNGDVVIVRKQSDVESGSLAIVLVNGENATLKKVIKQKEGISLVPFNPSYDTVFYSNKDINNLPIIILGKVIELRAKFD